MHMHMICIFHGEREKWTIVIAGNLSTIVESTELTFSTKKKLLRYANASNIELNTRNERFFLLRFLSQIGI